MCEKKLFSLENLNKIQSYDLRAGADYFSPEIC